MGFPLTPDLLQYSQFRRPRPMITTAALTMIGDTIRESAADPRTADNIRTMHQTGQGAEILRLIVRDDLGGAADVISAALWPNP